MTRKDYELIAAALLSSRPAETLRRERSQWFNDCGWLSETLENADNQFDRVHFLIACGATVPYADKEQL